MNQLDITFIMMVVGSVTVGWLAQGWKGRTGAAWGFITFFVMVPIWLTDEDRREIRDRYKRQREGNQPETDRIEGEEKKEDRSGSNKKSSPIAYPGQECKIQTSQAVLSTNLFNPTMYHVIECNIRSYP